MARKVTTQDRVGRARRKLAKATLKTTLDITSADKLGVNGDGNEVGYDASENKLVLPEQSTEVDV